MTQWLITHKTAAVGILLLVFVSCSLGTIYGCAHPTPAIPTTNSTSAIPFQTAADEKDPIIRVLYDKVGGGGTAFVYFNIFPPNTNSGFFRDHAEKRIQEALGAFKAQYPNLIIDSKQLDEHHSGDRTFDTTHRWLITFSRCTCGS